MGVGLLKNGAEIFLKKEQKKSLSLDRLLIKNNRR